MKRSRRVTNMLNWLIIIISLCTQTNVGNIKGETENIIDNQIEEAGTMTFEKYRKDILNKTNCDLVKKIVPVRGGVVWLVDKNPLKVHLYNLLNYLHLFSKISFTFDENINLIKTHSVRDCLTLNGLQPNILASEQKLRTLSSAVVTQLVR